MKTIVKDIPIVTIERFADLHGFDLEVIERRDPELPRYYAHFVPSVEIMERGCLVSVSGNGKTIEEATWDYAEKLSLTRIAVEAYTSDRREIDVPRLVAAEGGDK